MPGLDSKKNVSCITQKIANKMFETSVIRKIFADLDITQHFITDRNLIHNYYNNNLEYQIGLGEVSPSYR